MKGALVNSRVGLMPINIDLSMVQGLTQRQLSEMDGDTGVLLPRDLHYPVHWPVWTGPLDQINEDEHGEKEASFSSGRKFVFISYANGDREVVGKIRSVLKSADVSVWWDQDISPGEGWRDTIHSKLENAAAVLTIWTENSVVSKPVAEEAASAQRSGKLIHARLDKTPLPYGFSETQYADLQKWDGTAGHPEMLKLIQAVLDKLSPPTPEEIRDRLISATPIAAVIEDGLITARDSPPDARPPVRDETGLELRLEAQRVLADKVLTALQTLDNNLGEAIRFDLSHFLNQIRHRPASWYILSDSIADIQVHLESDDVPWPGSTKSSIERLCKNHETLRPLLQPTQPSPFSSEAPLPPPDFNFKGLDERALRSVAGTAVEVFKSPEIESVLSAPAVRTGEYLAGELYEAGDANEFGDQAAQRRLKKVKKAVVALAGFIGSAIKSIGAGVTGNMLTSPDAARVLLSTFKRIFDKLADMF
ncbi:TIR domain-containing protein [Rhizobium laguerreae]|uniref:TIR domain-containing protein n=1 Tax=Rhizobium laguerreae TaxID=1076926 RepID=UPI0014419168|nr:TIR domain-containing protein [Rhizobium laguerreae]